MHTDNNNMHGFMNLQQVQISNWSPEINDQHHSKMGHV